MTDDPLIQGYLQYVRVTKRLAARSVAIITLDMARLTAYCQREKCLPAQLQTVHIRRLMAESKSAGKSPRTLAVQLSSLRGFYKWLVHQGHVTHNPVEDVKTPKVSKPLPKALSPEEAYQLVELHGHKEDACARPDWLVQRDRVIVELLYGCGLRVSELVHLDVAPSQAAMQAGRGWIDLDSAEAHVLGKGSKRRSVPLGRRALAALKDYLPLRRAYLDEMPDRMQGLQNHQPALLLGLQKCPVQRMTRQAVWQVMRTRGVTANLNVAVHPHMLRHSFASHVLQESKDLRAVQELLGHASIASTQVYTRLDFQHLARIYDSAHPRAKLK